MLPISEQCSFFHENVWQILKFYVILALKKSLETVDKLLPKYSLQSSYCPQKSHFNLVNTSVMNMCLLLVTLQNELFF